MSEDEIIHQLNEVINAINNSLVTWTKKKRDFLINIVKNFKVGGTIFWFQGLCDFYEKSLALGESNLEGDDRLNCKSAHTYDCILGPLADMLDAVKIFINIRDHCIRTGDGLNCLRATPKETADMAKVICVIAEFVHRRKGKFILLVCGGSTLADALIPKIKKETSSASTIAFVNEKMYHLSLYDYFSQRCFSTKELQEYRIFCDLQKTYDDLRTVFRDHPSLQTMDFIVELASKLKMFKDLRDKSKGEMERLSCMWSARLAGISRSIRLSNLVKKLNGLTAVSDNASKEYADEIRAEITMLENETIEEAEKRQAAKASAAEAAAAALATNRRKASVTSEQRQAAKASAAEAAAAALATKRKASVIE